MSLSEFDLIRRYFSIFPKTTDVAIGIGDDAAVLSVNENENLVVSTDTVIEGVHFPTHANAEDIAFKALTSSLSDLAAMGATPRWFTLALTITSASESWLTDFSRGLRAAAEIYSIALVGGDLTQGKNLVITLSVMGTTPKGKSITRAGAKPGDKIFVTGTLGDAGYALNCLDKINRCVQAHTLHHSVYFLERYFRPTPRILAGIALRDVASAMIDISDGFLADLNHLLTASSFGALLQLEKIPISPQLLQTVSRKEALSLALSSGDDYELCFTVSPKKLLKHPTIFDACQCLCSCVGEITASPGIYETQNGKKTLLTPKGYEHFQNLA